MKLLENGVRQMFLIKRNLMYFDKLKLRLHTDSQILIAYHWRRYKKAKDKKITIQKALEAEKLAKKKKNAQKINAKNAPYKSKTFGKGSLKLGKTTGKSSKNLSNVNPSLTSGESSKLSSK